MQGISIYEKEGEKRPIYHTFHERNGTYLEREQEPDIFSVLKDIDDCDPSSFHTVEALTALMADLELVIKEAENKNDTEMQTHLTEVLVLARLCLWNIGRFTLVISPFEHVPIEKIPNAVPNAYKTGLPKRL